VYVPAKNRRFAVAGRQFITEIQNLLSDFGRSMIAIFTFDPDAEHRDGSYGVGVEEEITYAEDTVSRAGVYLGKEKLVE
jgi:hypothetical protein